MPTDPGFGTHIREGIAMFRRDLRCTECKCSFGFVCDDPITETPRPEYRDFELWCSYGCSLDGATWNEREAKRAD